MYSIAICFLGRWLSSDLFWCLCQEGFYMFLWFSWFFFLSEISCELCQMDIVSAHSVPLFLCPVWMHVNIRVLWNDKMKWFINYIELVQKILKRYENLNSLKRLCYNPKFGNPKKLISQKFCFVLFFFFVNILLTMQRLAFMRKYLGLQKYLKSDFLKYYLLTQEFLTHIRQICFFNCGE